MKKRLKTEKVKSHKRLQDGKLIRVTGFKRKPRDKRHTGIHKAETRRFEVIYYRDKYGRLVSRRKYSLL